MLGLQLQRDDLAARPRERLCDPDRRVAAQGADLEVALHVVHFGEQVEELALSGRHVDLVEVGGKVGLERGGQGGIVWQEGVANIGVDIVEFVVEIFGDYSLHFDGVADESRDFERELD